MKIVRLGMTESSILILTFISKNYILPNDIKHTISKILMNMVNWLYSTSGYYDKSVEGKYFNFNYTALNKNFFSMVTDLGTAIENCEISQMFIHEGFVMNLFNTYKNDFIKKFKIKKLSILNGTQFQDRIPYIFDKMNNKKVLVLSSFVKLINQQYESGNLHIIYPNFPNVLSLVTIQTPYCYTNNGPHQNYFETLSYLFEQIKTMDFDIAVLGCGIYGHMLTHKIHSELNKDAIYVGGSIQTLFGILSSREKNHGAIKYDEHWITEIPEEYRPENYKLIEDGCYW
jgi:hypothetical protein